MANEQIQAKAQAEAKRLARIIFPRAGRRLAIPFTEHEFAEYLATMSRAGALLAPDGETHREVSRRGGIARAKKLSPEKRQAIASYGGKVSAAKKKCNKVAAGRASL